MEKVFPSKEEIEEVLKDIYKQPTRKIVVYTGVGGKDDFDIRMEIHMGYKRIYLATKLPRIARRKGFVYKRDYRKRWYILKKVN